MTGAPAVATALQSARLRRFPSAKLVWLYVAPTLDPLQPRVLKVGQTARALGLPRQRVRGAFRMLTRWRFLTCATPATTGTAGEYILGPRALHPTRRVEAVTGHVTTPVRAREQLSLLDVVA